ncbi:hypothetical protein [Nocardia sp. NPDC004722]
MNTTARRTALGAALLTAVVPLSFGTAHATADFTIIAMSASYDAYGCELTTESCRVMIGYHTDHTDPVTFAVDGTTLGTVADNGEVIWTPQQAGKHTLTAQQGTQTATLTVNLIGYNSVQGVLKRYFGIDTGSANTGS